MSTNCVAVVCLVLCCLSMFKLIVTAALFAASNGYSDPDVDRTVPELIASRKFVCETHYVTTDDGYILTVHRIVNPRRKHHRFSKDDGKTLKVMLASV